MTAKEHHWTAEPARYVREMADWQIRYNPTPGGRKNADGSTSYSLSFPVLRITEYVADPEQGAKDVAAALNREPAMIAALEDARSRLRGAGMLGGDDDPVNVALAMVEGV